MRQSGETLRAGPPAEEAGGLLTIDLDALAGNCGFLQGRVGRAECAAVVKADAYGIGLEPAVRALGRAGCRTFFVAHLSEGTRVRTAWPDATVYVLNGFLPGTFGAYARSDLRPVLGSREEISEWAACCRQAREQRPAALHVDTGMNRLGLPLAEGFALAGDKSLDAFEPALLMSHLVSAEAPDDPINARQVSAFADLRSAYPALPASLANSSGIFLPDAPKHDLARPGYALYGGNPTPGRPNPMRPVVRLEARVIQIREAAEGERAGYNGQWTAGGPRRLAILSIGYADGFPRAASGTDAKAEAGSPAGEAIVAGRRCPFAGRVSMDLIIVDVTELPGDSVRRGDPATLIGGDLTVDQVGRRAGTIGYEILTGLGARYARTYRGL